MRSCKHIQISLLKQGSKKIYACTLIEKEKGNAFHKRKFNYRNDKNSSSKIIIDHMPFYFYANEALSQLFFLSFAIHIGT